MHNKAARSLPGRLQYRALLQIQRPGPTDRKPTGFQIS